MSDHFATFRRPVEPPLISFARYVAMVRKWDRDALIRGAGWASAQNNGRVITNGEVSKWLPWNIAGMAITAICRGTPNGAVPTSEQLRELIAQFGNIDDGSIVDEQAAFHGLERLFYEQMPYQQAALSEWSRAQALFMDTPFPLAHVPEVMRDGWVEELLGGVSIPEYSATGFVMLAAALSSNGLFSPVQWGTEMPDLIEILPRERVEEIGRAHFLTTIDGVKDARRAVPSLDRASEKYAFNPLIDRPFLSGVVAGAWIAPSTDLIEQKMGVAGIVYLAIDRWQTKFTRDLGRLFEAYAGRHLSTVSGAALHGEIAFGPRRRKQLSTDWILVTDSLVVLVEVKASSPTESIRQSVGELFGGVKAKLADAVAQLNKSAAAIVDDRDAFAAIPIDRPLAGLVVTLGNFPSAGFAYRMGQLGTSTIPIAFISIGELEALVTLTANELAETLKTGFAKSDVPGLIENMNSVLSASPTKRNSIVDAAWLANPLMQFLRERAQTTTGES